MELQRVKAVQDNNGHWYVIPVELSIMFTDLHNKATDEDYDAQEEFMKTFDQYRTGGDLNNTQLWAVI